MAATATARTQHRRAPRARAARPAPRARAAAASPPTLRRARTNRLVPALAVGRTALAVGGIADSGLVFRLTRGRLWIGLLAVLLVGIVGLNVMALSFSASSSNAATEADELERANSALQAQMQMTLTTDELEQTASKLDLIVPAPGAYRYLKADPADAEAAAQRLRDGEIVVAETAAAPEEAVIDTAATMPVVADPAATTEVATTPVDPAPTATTPVAPVETAAPPADPAPTAALGGVTAP